MGNGSFTVKDLRLYDETSSVRWATKTLPADITFVSFFITFAVAVTATMLFVFNISTIVIYSFFVTSGNSISNVSSNVYAE